MAQPANCPTRKKSEILINIPLACIHGHFLHVKNTYKLTTLPLFTYLQLSMILSAKDAPYCPNMKIPHKDKEGSFPSSTGANAGLRAASVKSTGLSPVKALLRG
jgi:hypothetical protein